MEETVGKFEGAAEEMKTAVQRALVQIGIYAFKITSALGTGRMDIETRPIDFEDEQEIRHLKEKGLITYLDKETLCALKERGLIE